MSKSIIQEKGSRCFLCDEFGGRTRHEVLEEHHCFGGPNRKLSERYGLKIYLCVEHHRTGKYAVHTNADMAEYVHTVAQEKFNQEYPDEDFVRIFGKNYLD